MKIKIFLALFLISQSCATTTNSLVEYRPPLLATVESVPPTAIIPVAKHKVVHIRFSSVVTRNSMNSLINQIESANRAGAEAIVLEINSPGGDVAAGIDGSRAIEMSKAPVVCVVDGDASSMGSYILQSCDVRMMTKRSIIMIHEPAFSGGVGGQPKDIENALNDLVALNKALTEQYAKKMNISAEDIRARIANGVSWYLNWDEAKYFKAVDQVVYSVEAVLDSYRSDLKAPAAL